MLAAKLAALVGRVTDGPSEPLEIRGLPEGCVAAAGPDARWVLLEHDPLGDLGAVLYALQRHGRGDEARLVVGFDDADDVSLRLAAFADPPALWVVQGTAMELHEVPGPADAARAAGPPATVDLESWDAPPGGDWESVDGLVDAIRRRHPDLLAEPAGDAVAFTYLGLEVARLVRRAGTVAFEVGVGEHDQDARRAVVGQRAVSGDARSADLADLEHALETVRRHRRADGPPHPLKRLRRSRWLRSLVMADPRRAALEAGIALEPVGDLGATRSLRTDPPAPAIGPGEVVVCSAGIDPDLVPAAAATWLQAADPDDWPRLTLVVPPGDDHPLTRSLLDRVVGEARSRLVTAEFASSD